MAIQTPSLGTPPTGAGGDTVRSAIDKLSKNFTDNTNAASRLVGTEKGNVMEVGAFGLGSGITKSIAADDIKYSMLHGTYIAGDSSENFIKTYVTSAYSKDWVYQQRFDFAKNTVEFRSFVSGTTWRPWQKFLTSANTTTDANGFIKAASPVIKVYSDHIETNETSALQNIKFEKLGVGDYLIKGTTGFADEGWYIEMPKDANGNVLVAVIYKELDNRDISVKTFAKMFDEETGDIIPNISRPRDIPANRWIDIRLNELPTADAPVLPVTGG